MRMPDMTGLELVRELNARGCRVPIIMITGHGDIPLAVEAMRAGVADFIEKPFGESRMIDALNRALEAGPPPRRAPPRTRRRWSASGWRPCRSANARCWTAWSTANPTR